VVGQKARGAANGGAELVVVESHRFVGNSIAGELNVVDRA
jgi:hypothetical protein